MNNETFCNEPYDRRNPYMDSDGNPLLLRSYCTYFDILGFKDMSSRSNRESNMKQLQAIYRVLKENVRIIPPISEIFHEPHKYLKYSKSFSDNVAIGFPFVHPEYEHDYLSSVISQAGFFQLCMAEQGYFVRGAITLGDLHISENTVFGPALNKAVDLEKSLSVFPRIILDESITKAIKANLEIGNIYDWYINLLKDHDSQIFVNYLNSCPIAFSYCFMSDIINSHKTYIEKYMDEYKKDTSINRKYIWCANYHNFFCEERMDSLEQETYKIDVLHSMKDRLKISKLT